MQEAQDSISGGSSFSNLPGPTIKEEDCAREKDHPPEAEYLNSRCVLFTYFHGDISSVVDEHFSRALSQPTSYVHGSASNKSARGRPTSTSWRGSQNRTKHLSTRFHLITITVFRLIDYKGWHVCLECKWVFSFLVYYCVHILLKYTSF